MSGITHSVIIYGGVYGKLLINTWQAIKGVDWCNIKTALKKRFTHVDILYFTNYLVYILIQ